jgi:molecular chaperone GrpE
VTENQPVAEAPLDAGPVDDVEVDPNAVEAQLADAEARLRRALADFDNLRKRYEREVVRERSAERARVIREWLPIVDDLERVLDHAAEDPAVLIEGVRAVRDQAIHLLARLGFPRFDDVGKQFDPSRHDAVAMTTGDAPSGTVVAVVRPGYGTDESVLRPAGVVVAGTPS